MLNPSPEQEEQWENDKRDCLARHLLATKNRADIVEWLSEKPEEFREDMRRRLNEQRRARKADRATGASREALIADC